LVLVSLAPACPDQDKAISRAAQALSKPLMGVTEGPAGRINHFHPKSSCTIIVARDAYYANLPLTPSSPRSNVTEKESVMQMPTRLFVALAVAVTLAAATVQAPAQAQTITGQDCEALFNTTDTDHDGKISIEEFVVGLGGQTYAARKVLKERFAGTDTNKDDVITKDEFCIPVEPSEQAPEEECADRFKKMDTDHDGRLSITEFMVGSNAQTYGARKVSQTTFIIMDTDRDELLTLEEFCKGKEQGQ
jgi:Ca2+-binding EF-hand superfamily protein